MHIQYIYNTYLKNTPWEIDFELKLAKPDKLMTPQELYFISNELQRNGIKMASMELDAEKARLVTDDCSLFELTGRPVQLTQGDYANLKITTREDLPRAEQKEGNDMRIGHGYDVHRLVEDRKLILGGVEVPFEKGLLGHSDADVLALSLIHI